MLALWRSPKNRAAATILFKNVPDLWQFGAAVLNKENRKIRFIEKPKELSCILGLAKVSLFSSFTPEVISRINPSWRGKLEITNSIPELLNMGFRMDARIMNESGLIPETRMI